MQQNPNYINQMININRAIGQLEGVKKMIVEEKYCVDILTQLKAANSAIKSITQNILNSHIQHCLINAVKNQNEKELADKVNELQKVIKNYGL